MAKYTTYTKEHLANALFDLMAIKPLEEISIIELAEKAQVNRASFYRNFKSKEDVLLHRLTSRYWKWVSANEALHSRDGDPYLQTCSFFRFMLSERDLLNTLNRTNTLGVMLLFLEKLIGPVEGDDPTDSFYRSFHVHGVYGVYVEWIRQGMIQSPEEMAALIVYEMSRSHESLIRKVQVID